MRNETENCDLQMIEACLQDRLSPEQNEWFTQHLENCGRCRTILSDEAAGLDFWKEAAGLLVDTNHYREPDAPGSGSWEAMDSPIGQFSVKTILDWLHPTDDPEMLGRIGEYEISGVVGVGGMGAVLKGFDKSLLRIVAIKVMAPHLANNGSARIRFEREARAAAAISHDNVVDIYLVSEMDGLPYLVMPYARGPSLQKRIEQGGPLSTLEVIQVGRQIAAGLAAAHEQGLVHRDIKPANILLNDGIERLLITDFGVASAMDDASMTQTGMIAGTPQFMSPEQARGEPVDQRSDLFSLGAVLYTACTGRPPFRADAPFAVLRKITDTEARPIRDINPDIPDWLENAIFCLLGKDPAARFKDATEVEDLFEKSLAHLRQPTQVALPATMTQLKPAPRNQQKKETKRPVHRTSLKVIGILMSFFAVVGLSIAGFFQFTEAPKISGAWEGESWRKIQLSSVEQANDWYAGSFVDAEGKKGALHLEWSPLRRRFDGRWSVGAERSGTIVLRIGNKGAVKGAILTDSQFQSSSDAARLRDFEWQPGSTTQPSTRSTVSIQPNERSSADPTSAENPPVLAESPPTLIRTPVYSPAEGVIEKLGENIKNGSRVTKGQLLFQMKTTTHRLLQSIHGQRSGLKKLTSQIRSQNDAIKSMEDALQHAQRVGQLAVDSARAEYEAQASQLSSLKELKEQALKNHQRGKKLYEKGIEPESKIDQLKAKSLVASAAYDSAQATAQKLKFDLESRLLELEAETQKSNVQIENAKSELTRAESQRSRTESRLADLESQQNESRLLRINAPCDGTIMGLRERTAAAGGFISKNFMVLMIQQDPKVTEKTTGESDPNAIDGSDGSTSSPPTYHSHPKSNANTEASSGGIDFQSYPSMLALASKLEKRIREGRSNLQKHNKLTKELEKSKLSLEKQLTQQKDNFARLSSEDSSDQLEAEIDKVKNNLSVVTTQLENSSSEKSKTESELNAANRELKTITDLLELEMQSRQQTLKLTRSRVKMLRAAYKMGDVPIAELNAIEAQLGTQEKQLELLRVMQAHFTNIGT